MHNVNNTCWWFEIPLPWLLQSGGVERGPAPDPGFCFQVTGDNVHSLALCDFDGDGKKEVCGGGDTPLCVQLNKFSHDSDLGVGRSVSFSWLLLGLCCLNNELTGLIYFAPLF